jgi:catechol 2,3-dioxygenase-like lactoylglutathione lyase family enzyme
MGVEPSHVVPSHATPSGAVSPVKFAHMVFRTSRYQAVIDWYCTVLGGHVVFSNDALAFLTYDDEHHRVAIINMPGLVDQQDGVAGVHHAAFTYASLTDLMNNYERLRDIGIRPVFVINHGPTTSLYYADPDGNQIELQIDNYDEIEDSTAFFFSEAFAENPIGVEFDPDDLLARLRAGEPEETLKKRPDIGKRGLADVKLR